MSKRVFDESFKKIAIDLSYATGSVKEVAEELGIDTGRISKWRQQYNLPEKSTEVADRRAKTDQKATKRAEGGPARMGYEDPMLTHVCGYKKAVSIFSRGDGSYSDL